MRAPRTTIWTALLAITGAITTPAAAGTLAITEFLNNANGADDHREFVEIFNYGAADVDLAGWTLEDGNGPGVAFHFPAMIVPSGGYVIVTRNKTVFQNEWLGGVSDPRVLGGQPWHVNNTANEELVLIDPDGAIVWNLGYTGGDANAAGAGRAVFLTEIVLDHTDWGFIGSAGISFFGTDGATGTGGYQHTSASNDPHDYVSTNGDHGSPLLGGYATNVESGTWPSGTTHTISGGLVVRGELVIQSGVTVEIADGGWILVDGGDLVVEGTAAAPVHMTTASPADRWDGLHFRQSDPERPGGAGVAEIRHLHVERTNATAILIEDSTVIMRGCRIEDVLAPNASKAYGIRIVGDSHPIISNTTVSTVQVQSTWVVAPDGGDGNDGCLYDGENIQWQCGGPGEPGTNGIDGASAYGIALEAGGSLQLVGCTIDRIWGGHGGIAGDGGNGGKGSDGWDAPPLSGNDGGCGAWGNPGGAGGRGGHGGHGIGVSIVAPSGPSLVAQNVMTFVNGGNGSTGGDGGNGGQGGTGGKGGGLNPTTGCGHPAEGGPGGPGGVGGAGGKAGHSRAIEIVDAVHTVRVASNTVARCFDGLTGYAGTGGGGGSPGANGAFGLGCYDIVMPCYNPAGDPGPNGAAGAAGRMNLVHADGSGPGATVEVDQNIYWPEDTGDSVGLQADGDALIIAGTNCFSAVATNAVGEVALGGPIIVADPMFVNIFADDFRLQEGSPCVDAGDASLLPADLVDLDDDGDTSETLPLDHAMTMRVQGAGVDLGAFELPYVAPCPDVDGDQMVGASDLLALLAAWGTNPGGPPDLDGDGAVNTDDLLSLLAGWGACEL